MPRRETRCGAIWRTTRPKPVLRPTASHATCLITQPNATLLREPSLFYARGPVAAFIMALRGHGYSLPLSHVYACLFPAYRYTTFEMASRSDVCWKVYIGKYCEKIVLSKLRSVMAL